MKRVVGLLCVIVLCVVLGGGYAWKNGYLAFLWQSAEEVIAEPTDLLTGEEQLWEQERPVAVSISNAAEATKQWGISEASVVMEALTEGQSTTLCLVYPSIQAVPKVGPIAQAKDVYAQFLNRANVIPVQKGATVYARNYQQYNEITAVDALEVSTNAFSSDPSATYPDEFTWYTDGTALESVLPSLGIESQGEGESLTVFGTPTSGTIPAASVQVSFSTSSTTNFIYNASLNIYAMRHDDHTPQLDATNGKQATFTNLILLNSTSSVKDDGYTRQYELSGGTGIYVNGGTCQPITWSRTASEAVLVLYDANGKRLPVQEGKSYIAILGGFSGQGLAVYDAEGIEQVIDTPEQ
jgi:hypothetical protein